jgi:hypothetical protein
MNIYINGYAISSINGTSLTKNEADTAIDGYQLNAVGDDEGYGDWVTAMAIVKDFAGGVFIETEYRIEEASLQALSVKTGAAMYLCYYESMGCYGCIYYVLGKKVLDRVSIVTGDIHDGIKGNEFDSHPTQGLIKQLFARLTGSTLEQAEATTGATFYFEPTTIKQ